MTQQLMMKDEKEKRVNEVKEWDNEDWESKLNTYTPKENSKRGITTKMRKRTKMI
jgi:hypothetical protein